MSLKNEQKISIRRVQIEDAETLLAIQSEVFGEGEFFIPVSDELNTTLDEQKQSIDKLLKNDRETMLVAEVDGEVVGWIQFKSSNLKRLHHTGSIGILIQKEFRNIGIGKYLMIELLKWAEQHPIIEKVSLGVFSSNHRAISLYKKMGFYEQGRKVKEFKFKDGEYVDDILMYKFV